LTPDLIRLIFKMMANNPAERPTVSEILNSPLVHEHDVGYRQWNRRFYFLYRTFRGNPLALSPKHRDEDSQWNGFFDSNVLGYSSKLFFVDFCRVTSVLQALVIFISIQQSRFSCPVNIV
jgi:hypothetical protein